jgi:DNA polymerase-3 subunit delta
VATLRNHLKKMLIISSMQDLDRPVYSPGLSFQAFKGGYLERLKSSRPNDGLPKDLPGHPFALYMMFQKAENFRTPELTGALSILLETEYRLKSTGLSEKIILESMFFKLLGPPPAQGHKAMIVGR